MFIVLSEREREGESLHTSVPLICPMQKMSIPYRFVVNLYKAIRTRLIHGLLTLNRGVESTRNNTVKVAYYFKVFMLNDYEVCSSAISFLSPSFHNCMLGISLWFLMDLVSQCLLRGG